MHFVRLLPFVLLAIVLLIPSPPGPPGVRVRYFIGSAVLQDFITTNRSYVVYSVSNGPFCDVFDRKHVAHVALYPTVLLCRTNYLPLPLFKVVRPSR